MKLQRTLPIGDRNKGHGRLPVVVAKNPNRLVLLVNLHPSLARTGYVPPILGLDVRDQVSVGTNLNDLSLNASRHVNCSWDVTLAANSTRTEHCKFVYNVSILYKAVNGWECFKTLRNPH